MIMFIDFIKCELHHLIFFSKFIMIFHGPIYSKKKSSIGRKQKMDLPSKGIRIPLPRRKL